MSLTSHLNDKASPLRALLAKELPDLSTLRAMVADRLPKQPLVVPVSPDQEPVPWSGIGTAIDHRLRLAFSHACAPDPHRHGELCTPMDSGYRYALLQAKAAETAAAKLSGDRARAAGTAARAYGAAARLGASLFAAIAEVVDRARPADRSVPLALDDQTERALCRLLYAAAWFDDLYRLGDLRRHRDLMRAITTCESLDEVLTTVPAFVPEDMAKLASLASDSPLSELRASSAPEQITGGPVFAGSRDVSGADADVIVARTLLDFKTTIKPSPLSDLRQLAGYLLLDYTDTHDIASLALYYTRQGVLITFDVEEFLGLAGARKHVGQLRVECAERLSGLLTRKGAALAES